MICCRGDALRPTALLTPLAAGPHVHIVRDPRWGRLCETFGEDPLLSRNYAAGKHTVQTLALLAAYLCATACCSALLVMAGGPLG